ncbi:hypothetical protein [Cytophaga hutchinsonii]|jgi:hypothetical protein|uniref:Secretion system C-terminal sorting domain-containing protein n=1 Tax=Cytophaga hutchinsonii (strain ATCC 33406 / DSM 1761 / CIP 103989 / NBRC 15051 / NCIMB 9469 / D465) TaxID=269798 RepID=A0A6N4SSV3_CYTH3|nr:hypothetical protein [Cytophaga hutchinsonii]ABG59487.1 hypothetical protein CHU_2224 [Cytophaga hutchinsonii ATCC 33406]SFX96932.1 hypothetical protein SAMN04487930_11555 [Cytophaga hutchinsonii ATCC 33406]
MVNMYAIRKQFFIAIGLFSFFSLFGFLNAPANASFENTSVDVHNAPSIIAGSIDFDIKSRNPLSNLNNGTIELKVIEGKAPYKILVYSTTMPLKEYQVSQDLLLTNLAAGDYMIVVSGRDNAYRSKTITLSQE